MIFLLAGLVFSSAREYSPTKFRKSDTLSVMAHSLRSPLRAMPLDFYIDNIFCRPGKVDVESRSIGQVLTGGIIQTSPFQFTIGEKKDCVVVCRTKFTDTQAQRLIDLIDSKYKMFLSLDNVPLVVNYSIDGTDEKTLESGFDIGFVKNGKHYLRNNLRFLIHLLSKNDKFYVTGFDLNGANSNTYDQCFQKAHKEVAIEDKVEIPFTYSFAFQISSETDMHRVDRLFENRREHLGGSVVTSLLAIGISTFILVFLVLRTACKTTRSDDSFDEYDGCEWKLIHGDVFRSPIKANSLSVGVGMGVQIVIAAFITILLGSLKYVAFTSNGAVIDAFVLGLILAAPVGGFVAGKLFRTIGVSAWRPMLVQTTLHLPVSMICAYLIVYFAARSFSCTYSLSFFLGAIEIAVPTFIGVVLGLQSSAITFPQKVNQLPRQIPPQKIVGSDLVHKLFGGPFLAIAVVAQVHNLVVCSWTGIWFDFHTSALFLGLVALICQALAVGVVVAYVRLTHENYHWWWPSYSSAAFVGPCLVLYALYFMWYVYKPDCLRACVIYLAVSAALAYLVSKACGAVSFLGALVFVELIYNSLKME